MNDKKNRQATVKKAVVKYRQKRAEEGAKCKHVWLSKRYADFVEERRIAGESAEALIERALESIMQSEEK